MMNTLFPVEVPGFIYATDFITAAEEAMLIEEIGKISLHTFQFQGYAAKRKVASFGYDWSFETRSLSKGKAIPSVFNGLVEKVAAFAKVDKTAFAELLVTEYPPGSVINWHRDAPPFDLIAGVSLSTSCMFRLRPHDKAKQGRRAIVSLPVERRSIYIMKDAARSDWEHSITPVKTTRYSITLRTLKNSLL
jgi:alkylated DNA repair dioxygenase AlkB